MENKGNVTPNKYRSLKRKVALAFFLLITIAILGIWGYYSYPYSDGNRAGLLIKFSTKGYIFKTNEGELNLGGINAMPGSTIVNNMWKFSVKDEKVANELMEMEGLNVRLHYKEYLGTLPWRGDSKYVVDNIKKIEK
jgi:hypothetical protein